MNLFLQAAADFLVILFFGIGLISAGIAALKGWGFLRFETKGKKKESVIQQHAVLSLPSVKRIGE